MRPPAHPSLPFVLAAVVLAVLAASCAGCGTPGTLTCGGSPCLPWTDGGGSGDGGGPGRDAGGDLPDAGDRDLSSLRDTQVPLPDLHGPVGDLPPDPDLGTSCSAAAWPRVARGAGDPSGGSGGAPGDGELQVQSASQSSSVLVHVPGCPPPDPPVYGLVVLLHDADGDRDYLRYKWRSAAAARGYVLALPQAPRSYGDERNWLDQQEDNRDLVLKTVEALEGLYDIDRGDVLLSGLGVGATFANQIAAADPLQPFYGLLLVNGTLWDPALEQRGVKSFIVLGNADAPYLAQHPGSDVFRYLHLPGLGPYYPGPAWPARRGDREVPEVSPTSAVDWFWP